MTRRVSNGREGRKNGKNRGNPIPPNGDKRSSIANFPIRRHLSAGRASDPVTLLLIIGPLLHALPCKIGPGINLNARTAGGEDAYALPRTGSEERECKCTNTGIQTRDIYKPKVKSEQKVCVTERVTNARGPWTCARGGPSLRLRYVGSKGSPVKASRHCRRRGRGDYANLRASLRRKMKSGPGSNESADTWYFPLLGYLNMC